MYMLLPDVAQKRNNLKIKGSSMMKKFLALLSGVQTVRSVFSQDTDLLWEELQKQ